MSNIVLVWAWGSGISSVAYILKDLWYTNIVWIDWYESQITKQMQNDWINMIIWHGKYEVQEKDFVIYSDAAINSPEVKKSFEYAEKKLKQYHYPFSYHQFLGEISKYMKTISIAWTHGKSTTTSIMINTFSELANDFWLWVVWALVPQFNNKNYLLNKSHTQEIKSIFDHIIIWKSKWETWIIKKFYFILEADEFNKHFLYYDTDYSIITNIELDHSDVYPSYKEYIEVFQEFYRKTRYKVFVLNWAKNINMLNDDQNKIKVLNKKTFNFKYIFGQHNHGNCSMIYGLIKTLFPKIKSLEITKRIESFKWLWRRMEYLWENNNWCKIYTDYWHHPGELEAVLNAFRSQFPNKKLITVFQPHQARRVLEFWDYFQKVLKKFDGIIIYDIYIARENLEDLKKIFKNKDFNDINSVEELGNLFADKIWWTYKTNFKDIQKILEWWKSNEIIICFSAWNLDFEIRNNCEFKS